jgi:hypothetical protein
LAGGFLAGKYKRGGTPASDTRAGSKKPLYRLCLRSTSTPIANWNTIETVVRIAKAIGVTPSQVALSWLCDRPGVTAPIAGARTVKHLTDDLAAADLALDAQPTATLDPVSAPKSGGCPYGAFRAGQRARWLKKASPLPAQPYAAGSSGPLGRSGSAAERTASMIAAALKVSKTN